MEEIEITEPDIVKEIERFKRKLERSVKKGGSPGPKGSTEELLNTLKRFKLNPRRQ